MNKEMTNFVNGKIVNIPEVATIEEIRDEIREVKTFYMSIDNKDIWQNFKFKSGQFIMCTVFGAGEFAVSLPPSPENDRFHITVLVAHLIRFYNQLFSVFKRKLHIG